MALLSQILIACISDKKAGLKHAIDVWRRMRKKKLTFERHHYNLLLKAVRECGVGDPEFANQLVKQVGLFNSMVSLNTLKIQEHSVLI